MANRRPLTFKEQWSSRIAAEGHVRIPTLLIRNLGKLKISTTEFATLVGIISYRWSTTNPFPSVERLCEFSGLGDSAIRNHLRSLEAKGFILRIQREGQSSEYDIRPLIKRLDLLSNVIPCPIKKLTPPSQKYEHLPYQKTKTKVYPLGKIQTNNSGFEKIGDKLPSQYRKE